MKLLVIEDHAALVANLFAYFEPRGYIVDAAPDGLTGLQLASTNLYDAIVLDWMLPRLDGEQVLEKLRSEAGCAAPVIMMTARERTEDVIHALRTGADDYVVKPFDLAELEARIQAQVRRARGAVAATRLRVADLELDVSAATVTRAGTPIVLQRVPRRLLEVLMRASPAVVSRERLEEAAWGDEVPDTDLLRSQIHVLRRAIDAPFAVKLLHTVPREGYRLAEPASDA